MTTRWISGIAGERLRAIVEDNSAIMPLTAPSNRRLFRRCFRWRVYFIIRIGREAPNELAPAVSPPPECYSAAAARTNNLTASSGVIAARNIPLHHRRHQSDIEKPEAGIASGVSCKLL